MLGRVGWAEKKPPKLSWTHLVALPSTAATNIQFDDNDNNKGVLRRGFSLKCCENLNIQKGVRINVSVCKSNFFAESSKTALFGPVVPCALDNTQAKATNLQVAQILVKVRTQNSTVLVRFQMRPGQIDIEKDPLAGTWQSEKITDNIP